MLLACPSCPVCAYNCTLTPLPLCIPLADKEKLQAMIDGEKTLKDENIRLQRKLQRETERSEALSRALSESESSLEIDEERWDDQAIV